MNDLIDFMKNNKEEVYFELIAAIFVFIMGCFFRVIRRNVILRYIEYKCPQKGADVKT